MGQSCTCQSTMRALRKPRGLPRRCLNRNHPRRTLGDRLSSHAPTCFRGDHRKVDQRRADPMDAGFHQMTFSLRTRRDATCQSEWARILRSHRRLFPENRTRSPKFCLRANAPELESGLGLDDLAVHLKQRINEEINRSAFRFWIDHQIAPLCQFKSVSRIVTEIVIGQLRVLPRFTDVYRNPLTVSEKFGPAMIALDLALVLVRWNCRA